MAPHRIAAPSERVHAELQEQTKVLKLRIEMLQLCSQFDPGGLLGHVLVIAWDGPRGLGLGSVHDFILTALSRSNNPATRGPSLIRAR